VPERPSSYDTPAGTPMLKPSAHRAQPEAAPAATPSSLKSLKGLRLRKHADYQRAYAASRKKQSASMSWFLAPQPIAEEGTLSPARPRVGLTAGKVLGKAHERNRIKRRMREVLRLHADLLPEGSDLILHPRRSVQTMAFSRLEEELVRILRQARSDAARHNSSNPTLEKTVAKAFTRPDAKQKTTVPGSL